MQQFHAQCPLTYQYPIASACDFAVEIKKIWEKDNGYGLVLNVTVCLRCIATTLSTHSHLTTLIILYTTAASAFA